jgi:hypothetical protein
MRRFSRREMLLGGASTLLMAQKPMVSTGAFEPTTSMTFAQAIAGMRQVESIVFGSSAAPGPGQTAITNLTELAHYFNYEPDHGGVAIINGQVWGVYQPFNSTNFVFNPNSLSLVATLSPGFSMQPTAFCSIANQSAISISSTWPPTASTPITAFNYPTGATAPQEWQLLSIQGAGTYVVYTTSGTGSSQTMVLGPTFQSPSSAGSRATMAVFHQIAVGWVTGVSGNTAALSTSIPTFVKVGWYCMPLTRGISTPQWNVRSTITAIGGTSTTPTVTVDNVPVQLTANNWVLFAPPTQAAQIWRKDSQTTFTGFNGITKFAMQSTFQLPPSKGMRRGYSPTTLPAGAPNGFWGGWWMYSGASLPNAPHDYSELDITEMMYCNTLDSTTYTGNDIGPYVDKNGGQGATNVYLDTMNCTFGSNPWYCFLSYDLSAAPITIGFIVTETHTFRYINGTLWKKDNYQWTSGQPPVYGYDIALGTLNASLAANFLFPMFDSELPLQYQIMNLTMYAQ